MSLFGTIIGSDLNLLHMSPDRLRKLSGQAQWDFDNQLRHQCIRRAWQLSAASGMLVRDVLDLIVGRASIARAQAFGDELSEHFMEIDMGRARMENEWSTCFGLYIDVNLERIEQEFRADEQILALDWRLLRLEQLRVTWEEYKRNAQTSALARTTLRFAQEAAGRDAYTDHCQPLMEGLATALASALSAEIRYDIRFVRTVHPGKPWESDTIIFTTEPAPELIRASSG